MNRFNALLKLAELLDDDESDSLTTIASPPKFPFDGPVAIRTVTLYYTGNVRRVEGGFVVLGDAAWIPDAGRWSTFIAEGTPNEVEPFPDEVAVSLGSIVDVAPWAAALPRKVK
jgi:hypothetical protein